MGSKNNNNNNNNNFFELSFEIVNSNDKELKSTVGLEPVGPVHKYSLILIFNIQTGFWDVRFCFFFFFTGRSKEYITIN